MLGIKHVTQQTEVCFHFWWDWSISFWVFSFLQLSLQHIMGQDQYDTVALDTEIDITSSGLEADEWKPFIPAMTPQMHIQYQQPCDASLYLVITVWNKLLYSPSIHSPRGGKSSLNGETLKALQKSICHRSLWLLTLSYFAIFWHCYNDAWYK